MHYRHILLDLDGTLTDPKLGITGGVQYALAKFGIVEPDPDTLIPFIGPPLLNSFMDFYGMQEETAWQAVGYYREYFGTRGMYENEPYAGIDTFLGLLKEQGRELYVATSKPLVYAAEIVRHFGLEGYFTGIYGSELDGTRSDKGELIAYIMNKHVLNAADSVMIGDRKHDLIGAGKNGIDAIAAGYGYGTEEELRAWNPVQYYRTLEDLREGFARQGTLV